MGAHRVFIVALFSVVLIAMSVFAVQTLPHLFARGSENGDLCWPGTVVWSHTVIGVNPPVESNPPSYIITTKERYEHIDGACETNATCIPQYCECFTVPSNHGVLIYGVLPDPRVTEYEFKEEYVLDSLGRYNPRPKELASTSKTGYYIKCTDCFRTSYQ